MRLEAKTSFKNLARTKHFELWEALPKTGRNHQIRIHGAHVGLPLLGDKKYSGAEFPFLCLHNRRLEFPNGVVIESPAPKYFEDLAILEDRVFANRLHEIDRRQRLYRQVVDQGTDCLRLLQEQDAVLDLVDQDLSLIWNKPTWSEDNERGFEKLAAAVKRPLRRRFTKIKDQDVNPPPPPFAEQRLLRDWIRENSKDKTVAVLFSASNGTALAASQASELTLVDTSKSALNSARKQIANAKFLNRETLAYLDQCKTKQTKFDLIICDAPAFARGEKRNFKIENDLTELLTKMLDTLEPKGVLLFLTYVPSVYVNDLRVAFMSIRGKANFEITSLQSSLDCELPGEASNFKSLLIQT